MKMRDLGAFFMIWGSLLLFFGWGVLAANGSSPGGGWDEGDNPPDEFPPAPTGGNKIVLQDEARIDSESRVESPRHESEVLEAMGRGL